MRQKNPAFYSLKFGINDVIFIYAACCVISVLMSYLMKQTNKTDTGSVHVIFKMASGM